MKTVLPILIGLMLCTLSHAETIKGDITFKIPEPEEKVSAQLARQFKTEMKISDECTLTTALWVSDYFGERVVQDNADILNNSPSKKRITYSIAFFDEKGLLVVSASTTVDLTPGKLTRLGSCFIRLPDAQILRIRSYQISAMELPLISN